MAKFTLMDPRDVMIGRERSAREARQPYVQALEASDAGQIELQRGDVPSTVKRRLADAARDLGVRGRSSWADARQRTLVWKKTARTATTRTPRATKPARATRASTRTPRAT